jgi:hypothetical protein
MRKVLTFLFFVLILPVHAHAYIDPGSGGYLVGSVFPMIAGAFAVLFAFLIHFFRHTLKNFFRNLWNKHQHVLTTPPDRTKFNETISGAHRYDASAVADGYNLFDGRLIDFEGRVLKEWRNRYLGLLLPDGRYVAQEYYESRKWGLFTWDDKPVWEMGLPIHHDIVFTPQQTLLTFIKEMHSYKGRDVDFCVIVEFDLAGRELMRWSTWENLLEIKKFHRPLELDRPKVFFLPESARRKDHTPWGGHYDYYRLNSIQVLPDTPLGRDDARFRSGNWLISFRHGSMIFILDRETRAIVWKCIAGDITGGIEGQHAPTMLSNGRILIFDNGRYRGWSRVIEIDPVTLKIIWEYRADGFYTLSQGYVQRLPNANTLVTESECGRAFEITPEKRIVWEYYHPEKQDVSNSLHPENYGRRQWI